MAIEDKSKTPSNYSTQEPPIELRNLEAINVKISTLTSGIFNKIAKFITRSEDSPEVKTLKEYRVIITSFDFELNTWCDEVKATPEHAKRLAARKKILLCYANGGTKLDLSNLNLTSLPEGISHLKELTYLNLSGNNFKKLPDALNTLHDLDRIDLDASQHYLCSTLLHKNIEVFSDAMDIALISSKDAIQPTPFPTKKWGSDIKVDEVNKTTDSINKTSEKIRINIDFQTSTIKTLYLDESTTIKELIEKISSSEEMKNYYLSKVIYGGRDLVSLSDTTTVKYLIYNCTIYVVSFPKLSPEDWVAYAIEHSNVGSLQPLKPVATPHSGQSPKALSVNWRSYSEKEHQRILSVLSSKITNNTDHVKVHLSNNTIIFYLENHLKTLLTLAEKDMDNTLEMISTPIHDPEILSLIYIMFGDLVGLSPTKQKEDDLTQEGKRIFELYQKNIKHL